MRLRVHPTAAARAALAPTFALVLIASLALAPLGQPAQARVEPWDEVREQRTGWFLKGSVLITWKQSSNVDQPQRLADQGFAPADGMGSDDLSMRFNDTAGPSVGVGNTIPLGNALRFTVEGEYAYRQASIDNLVTATESFNARGNMRTHSAMANALGEVDLGRSPFGLYGGAGFGRAWTNRRIERIDGESIPNFRQSDDAWAFQAMGGIYIHVMGEEPPAMLYTGVRWFDADIFDDLPYRNEHWSIDIGLRLYF